MYQSDIKRRRSVHSSWSK